MDCQFVLAGSHVNLNDKFGVILKTMCMVFLILWSLVSGAFPWGKKFIFEFCGPDSKQKA